MNINRERHKDTPLYTALEKYAASDTIHFDVPGHKKRNNKPLTAAFGEKVLAMDANSTKELDLLSNSSGVILEAEELYADAYGADHAFMLVNGSTSGVMYMIMTACQPKEKIIMPRNVHKSAINAVILSGATPIFIQPEIDSEYGIAHGMSFEEVKGAIQANPDAKAVFLINPTYFGATCDLRSIIRYCHRHNIAVLVDEAHGAHLRFHPELPESAAALGADMSTLSVHKTAGSLTQSSVLLLNEGIYKKHQLRTVINLLQTTSASYLLMASLDLARKNLVLHGKEIYDNLLSLTLQAKAAIAKLPGLSVLSRENVNGAGFYDYDETKLVVRVNELGLTGFDVYDILKRDYHIQVELAETYVVLAVVGVGDDKTTLDKLVTALTDISKRFYGKAQPLRVSMAAMFDKPKAVINPREAYYSPKKLVPLESAEGEISGEAIMIYPPGIPLIIPGERVTAHVLEHYKFYQENRCVIVHDQDEQGFIKVLGQ